jgi:pyruvate dehydrogenase E1 component alpha subunit/2-oxoisovalerate dehydrogenase E1 component alpha subunit
MVVIVSNNQFAYSTPTDRQFACEDLLDRAKGYGVGGHSVDGTDMLACTKVIGRAVQLAREGAGPQMVVARLLRLSGHGEHDDASYVPNVLKAGLLGRDCLEVAMAQLIEGSYATVEEVERWKTEFTDEVQAAVAQAQQEPTPDPWHEQWDACSTPTGRL